MMDTHYDAVVVGSGFGGSVTAYRLAEAGLRVCLLERGKVYPPGSFPRSPRELRGNFWDPSEGLYGMFDIWSFRGKVWSLKGLEAVVSSGLGGGSLIYANVLLRKDEKWFVQDKGHGNGYEYWPVNRAELDPHYDRAEAMLQAQQYPYETHAPYNLTPKTAAFKRAADELGLDWQLPKLGVTFANVGASPSPGEHIQGPHPNLHGSSRFTCRLCGECDIGCNYGSKNTLDYNYLTQAQRLGADIQVNCEVRSFEPRDGGGYTVRFVRHMPTEREGQKTATSKLPLETVTADQLVLAAGALGSTFLLLKNREAFPAISKQLGSHFCGNGDLLTFAFNSRQRANGKLAPFALDPSRGPVITSAIRVADARDGGVGRGFYIEDAGYPDFLSWILETNVPSARARAVRFAARRGWSFLTGSPVSNLSTEVSRVLGDGRFSSGALPMLGMGRDVPDGVLYLRKGYLNTDWNTGSSKEYFDRLRNTMRDIAAVWNADFVDNPIWNLSRVVTVHPLGGCPMGRDEHEGVVDSYGQVFNYPGLYIADGSVMPGPVGPNPSLTIAALADRFADQMVRNARPERKHAPVSQP